MRGHSQSFSKAKKAAEKEAKLNSVDKKKFTSKEYKSLTKKENKPMNPRKVAMVRGKSKRGTRT